MARLRLFCFPYAGGGASAFRDWPAGFSDQVEVCPLQLPGREERFNEPTFSTIAELVPAVVEAMAPMLNLPFVFYGHSMGSLIAFEVAHELRARGADMPLALFPAAHQAPAIPHSIAISKLPEVDLVAHVAKMSNSNKLHEHPELMRIMMPMLRSDFSLCDTYSYQPRQKLSCPITAIGGQEDTVSRDDLELWKEETEGAFEVEMLSGGHLFLSNCRKELLEAISRRLATLVA